jgi:Zn-finger nucleic acid-binding protein
MLCPACGHKLQEIQIDGFVYHICKDSCGGILIGNSEIEKFFSQTENIIQKIICVKSKTSAFYQNKLCPECSKNQMKSHYRNGFEVSNCPECKNLWLDIDELNKIREKYDVENEVVEEIVVEVAVKTADEIPVIKETTILSTDSVDDKITSDFKEANQNEQEITEKITDLLCPVCNQLLYSAETEDFEYHICRDGCGGILINNVDLKNILEFPENVHSNFLFSKSDIANNYSASKIKICPKCKTQKMMKNLRNSVEIDECYKCGNIWLDIGEFIKISKDYCKNQQKIKEALGLEKNSPKLFDLKMKSPAHYRNKYAVLTALSDAINKK